MTNTGRAPISFVVATMDRPRELARLLDCLEGQSLNPAEVVVADGGDAAAEELCRVRRPFPVRHLRSRPPSAARQRNAGIKAADPALPLIGLLDDDVLLEERAVERMAAFWSGAPAEVGGAAFNMTNHPPLRGSRWKALPMVERLGIYSRRPGAVTRSGFPTMIGTIEETIETPWLPSGAVVWRRALLERLKFDEWFSDYGYLEDLDFSYRAGKESVLKVVAEARYSHHPQASSRLDPRRFGRKEVANRLYFVRKHKELSVGLCRLGLGLRTLMSLADGLAGRDKTGFGRARGNLEALFHIAGAPAT